MGLFLLPAVPGLCPECATKHTSDQPHNQQSLHYQFHFYAQHGHWPTWADALAHCNEETKRRWTEELTKRGVSVETGEAQAHSPPIHPQSIPSRPIVKE